MKEFKTTRRDFAELLVGSTAVGLPAFEGQVNVLPSGRREMVTLDGDIEDGIEPGDIPADFSHKVPVPGLAHLAVPPFPGVDEYENREYILNMIGFGLMPPSAETGALGRTSQKRNYFWYQKSFSVPARRQVAILTINKAQFGTAVWLNGKKIGEHLGCFTRGHFDLTASIDWEGENHLLVRIGAHPGALPKWVPAGTDQEKPPLGQMTYVLTLQTPVQPDGYVLSATATWPSRPWPPVISRRNVTVVSSSGWAGSDV